MTLYQEIITPGFTSFCNAANVLKESWTVRLMKNKGRKMSCCREQQNHEEDEDEVMECLLSRSDIKKLKLALKNSIENADGRILYLTKTMAEHGKALSELMEHKNHIETVMESITDAKVKPEDD